jgi:hypothetical protein
VDRTTFIAALLAALERARIAARRHGRALLLKHSSGRTARVELDALYGDFTRGAFPLERAIPQLVSSLSRQLAPAEELSRAVLPVVRSPGFGGLDLLVRPHSAQFTIAYVAKDPDALRFVTASAAREAGLSLDALDEASWENLEPVRLERFRPEGVWRLTGEDGHDAARLLLPDQWKRLETALGAPPWRARLTAEAGVVVCREDSPDARRVLEALTRDEEKLNRDLLLPIG